METSLEVTQIGNQLPHDELRISKTGFLLKLRCERAVHLYTLDRLHRKKNVTPPLAAMGHEVEKVGLTLFPDVVDASDGGRLKLDAQVRNTERLMKQGKTAILQAAFRSKTDDGLRFCIADIWLPAKNTVIEIKSSTKLKDIHVYDCGFQYSVITDAGYQIKNFSIALVNGKYSRTGGEIDPWEYFSIKNITRRVRCVQFLIDREMVWTKKILMRPTAPQVDIGPHCSKPYDCPFKAQCWKGVPTKNSVFQIPGLPEAIKFELFRKGVINMIDVPTALLNDKQKRTVSCHKELQDFFDVTAVSEFLADIPEPLYFLDIETMNPAIPKFENTKPYEHVPFQFSLHRLDKNHNLFHREFLAEPGSDPRNSFIEAFLEATKEHGKILVYSSFEATQLTKLMAYCSKNSSEIADRIVRLKDLMTPFSNRNIYNRKFQGSISIKSVIHAFYPELSYSDLPIQTGSDASFAYQGLAKASVKEGSVIKKNLLEYCKHDTYSLVRLYQYLQLAVSKKGTTVFNIKNNK
jgi:hypothetical protein